MRRKDKLVPAIIQYLSVISAFIGLSLGIYIIGRFSICGEEIKEPEVQIVGVLLAAGLLGSVLDFILEKIIEDFVRKYLNEEKVISEVKEVVGKVMEETKAQKEAEEDENTKIEHENNTNLDTVIVPTTLSFNSILTSGQYECPERYVFKSGLKYIAFYMHKKIVGYGEIDSEYQKPVNGFKIFHIKQMIRCDIRHEKKGAYIQGKKYCSFSYLKNAKTTDDIR